MKRVLLLTSLVTGMLIAASAQATIIYQDDFSGAAGPATDTTPEVAPPGFEDLGNMLLDGSGGMTNAGTYRVKLDTGLLTDDPSIKQIKCTAVIHKPTHGWLFIAFSEMDRTSIFLPNIGPMMQFFGTWILRGGAWGGGRDADAKYPEGTGSEITAELTYHVDTQTADLAIDGTNVVSHYSIEHEPLADTNVADAKVGWLIMHASSTNFVIDSIKVETFTEPTPDNDIIYLDHFVGASASDASNSVPQIKPDAFDDASDVLRTDGYGRLDASASTFQNGYRVKLSDNFLNDTYVQIKWTATVFVPASGCNLFINFMDSNAPRYNTSGTGGPNLFMAGNYWSLASGENGSAGANGTGAISYSVTEGVTVGEETVVELTYNVADQTIDLSFNGMPELNGWQMVHTVDGAPADADVNWLGIYINGQSPAVDGGAYIENIQVEAIPPSGTVISIQ